MAVAPIIEEPSSSPQRAELQDGPGPGSASRPGRLRRLSRWTAHNAGALLPAALVLFFSFQAGGFFPGATGVAAAVLAVVLVLRVTLVTHPFAGLGTAGGVCAGALAAYATWTLVSVGWSDAPGRAVVEFNRTLLYLLAFLAATSLAHDPRRLALALRTTAAAVVAVCLVGWGSRVLPGVVEAGVGAAPERLAHPLTYWNAQGLIAALGFLLVVHLAASAGERRGVRVLAAAAAPVLASTLFLTYSRGALLAVLAGLAAYVVLCRTRGLLSAALAIVPASVMAVLLSFDAELLATAAFAGPAGAAEGKAAATGIALCALAAGLARLAGDRWLDPLTRRAALPPRARRPARIVGIVALLLILVPLPLALGAPGYAERTLDRFVNGESRVEDDLRTRFVNPANNGRLDHWRVGIDVWQEQPLRGSGAGTYATEWTQRREIGLDVQDAHSLYVEVLSELGLVGFLLLAGALLTGLATAVRRAVARRPPGAERSVDAVLVAVLLAWGIHAGLDWIWEMPAVTAWVFALAGIAVATRRAAPTAGGGPARGVRVAFGIGCLVLAVIPLQVVRSQFGLDEAVRAFRGSPQDCPGAIDASLRSLGALGARAEPWEIVAYCDVGAGEPKLAVRAARNAVARDPKNWTYRYALALVLGVAGEDPRPAARRALALNPGNALAQVAALRFRTSPRRAWPQVARELELPTG